MSRALNNVYNKIIIHDTYFQPVWIKVHSDSNSRCRSQVVHWQWTEILSSDPSREQHTQFVIIGLQIQKCTRVQMTSEGFTELSLKCTVFYSLEELDDVGLAVRGGEIDLFATSE